jgi:peptidoglycan-associated lipoprotein
MLHARRVIVSAVIVAAVFVGCAKRPALTTISGPAPSGGAEVAAAPATPPAAAAPAPAPAVAAPAPAPTPVTPAPAPVRPAPKDYAAVEALKPIHFEFDRYDIRPTDRKVLDANAAWLKQNSNQLVLIEGHCDERGTNEYNLGLGERRARATMNYLVSQGIQASRITVVSYGEERPVCTEKNESCWAKNRRAAFLAKEQ